VVVCHGNVIRYATMRALQLPPEAWLRTATFNCSLTYLVVRPSGSVSLRTFGDVGHLPMNMVSFSGHHGFAW
jgi:serine/threonine-protein phosphatase PGAM5